MSKGDAADNILSDGVTPTLPTIFLDVSEVAHKIVSFLPAKDVLGLHSVDKACHNLISKHEDVLFEDFLRSDFVEGKILVYIAEERELDYKRLYLAFLHRYNLPKQTADVPLITIPHRPPTQIETRDETDDDYEFPQDSDEDEEEDENEEEEDKDRKPLRPVSDNEDIGRLVFIARIGSEDNPNTCKLMDWEYYGTECEESGKKLVVDYHRNEAIFGSFFDLPDSDEVEDILTMATREKNPISEVNEILNETHRMTLHVVNVREYQVLSLMDKTKFAEPFGGADFTSRDTDMNIYGYGWDAKKKLYGVPPEGSPYYKNFTTRDFETREWDWEEELPKGVEEFEISGDIRISFHRYWKEWEVEKYNRSAIRICSFLRALMKDRCVSVGGGLLSLADDVAAPLTQPFWVDTDEILDRITSFASFEEQAGTLRLVCRKFDVSSLRQLKGKLEKTKVIGFTSGSEWGESWFKATVRSGWTEDCLASEEGVIDDALWFTKCRCIWQKCENKESCPDANKPVQTYNYRNNATSTLDINEVRKDLANGKFKSSGIDAECSFKQVEVASLYRLGATIAANIHKRMKQQQGYNGSQHTLNRNLKVDYGVVGNITSRQFVRSIFLIFARAKEASMDTGEEGNVSKKPRTTSIKEVTVGMAKTRVSVENGNISREKKIFRFYSSANEQMEICFEDKSSSYH